jgi:hypothetical protein
MVRVAGVDVDQLRPLIGRVLLFHGTLSGCDGFARNIYVTDAKVESP